MEKMCAWSFEIVPFFSRLDLPLKPFQSRGKKSALSHSHKVQFDLLVAVLTRPKIQRCRVNFINDWCRKTDTCKVHTFNVVRACIASLNSNVVEFRRMKISQFCRPFLAAVSTNDATKFP